MRNWSTIIFLVLLFAITSLASAKPQDEVIVMDKREIVKTYDMPAGGNLYVKNVSGDIQISSWSSNKIEVKMMRRGGQGDDVEVNIDRNSSEIEIEVDYPRNRDWSRFGRSYPSIYFEIKLPKKADISTHSTSGDIFIENIDGPVEAGTTSGDIELASIIGRIRGSSTSGRVRVTDCSSEVDAGSTSGDVIIKKVTGDVDAHSTSGDVEIEGVGGGVRAGSTSGDIVVENVQKDVDARSTSGDVDIVAVKSDMIDASTTSGNVDVEMQSVNPRGRYTFESNSGDVTLFIPKDTKAEITARARPSNIKSDFDIFENLKDDDYYEKRKTKRGYKYVYSYSRNSNSRRTMRGELNGGGARIDISVNSGTIDIREK